MDTEDKEIDLRTLQEHKQKLAGEYKEASQRSGTLHRMLGIRQASGGINPTLQKMLDKEPQQINDSRPVLSLAR